MGTRIFVGNLAYGSTEAALRSHFEQAGFEVRSARIIADRETGKSRGFGFVELADDAETARAITELEASELDGRRLSIREAHDRKDGGGPPRDAGARAPRGSMRDGAPPRGVVVERVGGGDARRGPPGPPRGPRPYGGGGGFHGGGAFHEPPPEPGWAKGEGRRSRKFDAKRRRNDDDDDQDW